MYSFIQNSALSADVKRTNLSDFYKYSMKKSILKVIKQTWTFYHYLPSLLIIWKVLNKFQSFSTVIPPPQTPLKTFHVNPNVILQHFHTISLDTPTMFNNLTFQITIYLSPPGHFSKKINKKTSKKLNKMQKHKLIQQDKFYPALFFYVYPINN